MFVDLLVSLARNARTGDMPFATNAQDYSTSGFSEKWTSEIYQVSEVFARWINQIINIFVLSSFFFLSS